MLVRATCMHCHGTKCPILTAFFLYLFLLLFASLTFLQEGFWNLLRGFKLHKKIRFWVNTNWGTHHAPLRVVFSGLKKIKWKVLRIAWFGEKLVQKNFRPGSEDPHGGSGNCFVFLPPPLNLFVILDLERCSSTSFPLLIKQPLTIYPKIKI